MTHPNPTRCDCFALRFLDIKLTGREIHDVEQMKKMVPLIAHAITLSQHVSKLVLDVNVFDLDLGVQIDLSNNQSNATLWVLDTCLIVGLRPLSIILITASLSSKMYNWTSNWGELAFVTTWSTFDISSTSRLPLLFNLVLGFVLWIFPRHWSLNAWCVCVCVLWKMLSFYHHIPKIKSKDSILTQTSIQRNNFRYCGTVRHWRLLLAHPTYWDESSTSEDT